MQFSRLAKIKLLLLAKKKNKNTESPKLPSKAAYVKGFSKIRFSDL